MGTSEPLTSASLFMKLQQPHQPDAWARFEQLYTPLVRQWSAQRGVRGADADDVAQEVFAKLLKILPDPARPAVASFRGWLRALTFNACHDFHTRKGTRPLPAPDGLSSADAGEALSEIVEANDRRMVVRSALELIRPEFSEQTWAAFTGIAIQERPAAEVATELGISKNAVHLARNRVLTRLREEFGEFLS